MTDLKPIKNSCCAVKLKSLQNVGTSGYFFACTIFTAGLHFAGVRSTFGRFQHIIQKIVNIDDLVVGHRTLEMRRHHVK